MCVTLLSQNKWHNSCISRERARLTIGTLYSWFMVWHTCECNNLFIALIGFPLKLPFRKKCSDYDRPLRKPQLTNDVNNVQLWRRFSCDVIPTLRRNEIRMTSKNSPGARRSDIYTSAHTKFMNSFISNHLDNKQCYINYVINASISQNLIE